jgi:hypothetical protein
MHERVTSEENSAIAAAPKGEYTPSTMASPTMSRRRDTITAATGWERP